MADPIESGGLFVGRRGGPVRFRRPRPQELTARRRAADNVLANSLLAIDQERGAIERIFVLAVIVALVLFGFWFLILTGPGPSIAPTD